MRRNPEDLPEDLQLTEAIVLMIWVIVIGLPLHRVLIRTLEALCYWVSTM